MNATTSPPIEAPAGMWTVAEVASQLRVSPSTVKRLIARGKIRAIRVGAKHFIKAGELDRVRAVGTD